MTCRAGFGIQFGSVWPVAGVSVPVFEVNFARFLELFENELSAKFAEKVVGGR